MAADEGTLSVFLSCPTWIPEKCLRGHDGFIQLLGTLGLNPRTVGTTDFGTRSPMDQVITLMEQCKGAIILGYPQIVVAGGTVKGKTITGDLSLATEWNHIEAGLAHARRLPLLAIHHVGIDRGIFSRGAMNAFLYQRDLSDPNWPLGKDLQGALKAWKAECLTPR
jgi:hypothetical protein